MCFFRRFNSVLEKSFTVVYWEQRGTGKSFDPAIPRTSMTIEGFVADLAELVEYVRDRLGQDIVTIYGHSWGAGLGLLYSARFPEKVAAFVGGCPPGNWLLGERLSYAFAVSMAKRLNNRRALRALRSIGEPPHTGRNALTQRMWLSRFMRYGGGITPFQIFRTLISGPESSILDRACILLPRPP
jgi:pimeloyl-ACP methyl ester carboxylesterase